PGGGLAGGGVPRLRLRLPRPRRPRGAAGRDDRGPAGDVDAGAGDLPRAAPPGRAGLLRAAPRPADPDHGRLQRPAGDAARGAAARRWPRRSRSAPAKGGRATPNVSPDVLAGGPTSAFLCKTPPGTSSEGRLPITCPISE